MNKMNIKKVKNDSNVNAEDLSMNTLEDDIAEFENERMENRVSRENKRSRLNRKMKKKYDY
jgi:hypothetical protein